MRFDPFGARIGTSAPPSQTSNPLSRMTLGFTGQESEDDLGLINMNGRLYDPNLMRFITSDPVVGRIGYSQEYNRYSYANNSPFRFVDTTGFQEEESPPVEPGVPGDSTTVVTVVGDDNGGTATGSGEDAISDGFGSEGDGSTAAAVDDQAGAGTSTMGLGNYASQLHLDPDLGSWVGSWVNAGHGGAHEGLVLGADGKPLTPADNGISEFIRAVNGFAEAGGRCTAGPCSDAVRPLVEASANHLSMGGHYELNFKLPKLFGGGGGTFGLNLQLDLGGLSQGPGLFVYHPRPDKGNGFMLGSNFGFNLSLGRGPWSGIFDNYGVAVGNVGFSAFGSPGWAGQGNGWAGVSYSISVWGPVPVGAGQYQTTYESVAGAK